MAYREAPLHSRKMCDKSKIHSFLNRRRCKIGKTACTCGHHIGMVTENTQGMSGHRACADMKHRRKMISRYLEHIGKHKQQSLRIGKGSCKGSGRQSAVCGAGSPQLALHLLYAQWLAHVIFSPRHPPFLCGLPHRRHRGDRINSGDIAQRVCYMSGSRAPVKYLFHLSNPYI